MLLLLLQSLLLLLLFGLSGQNYKLLKDSVFFLTFAFPRWMLSGILSRGDSGIYLLVTSKKKKDFSLTVDMGMEGFSY